MNIDRDALIGDGDSTGCKRYSAQVRIRVRKHCQPLSENQFWPIIADNYYTDEHFSFELDQDQTLNLISLFSLWPVDSSASSPPIAKRCNYLSHSLPRTPRRLESRTIQNGPKLEYKAMQNGPKLEYKAIRNASKLEYKAVQYDYRLEYNAIQDGQRLEYTALQKSLRLDHKAIENLAVNQAYEDNGDFLQGNTLKESQVNATDEVEHVQISESSGQHLDDRSSHQTLDDYVDCNVSSSTETSESDEIEFHEKKSSSIPERVAELETLSDPQSLIHKLMQDVQELKGSQLKQIVKISILEQDLVDSKDEIQQLRNSHCHLESKARSVLDSAEVDSQLPSKPRSIFADPVFIVGGYDGSSWLSTIFLCCVFYLSGTIPSPPKLYLQVSPQKALHAYS
uniref:uncharacterized protein LOC122604933 n=1 Tax=Erigeron canadensis TaxID=72917 RepID=UPI001CB897A0|nr:uncharacterized protein LOC122604933 [Erigeron canadensis]